jgi:hypothetical protein
MRIGIVGSREFPQLVEWFIRDLPKGVMVLRSGTWDTITKVLIGVFYEQ